MRILFLGQFAATVAPRILAKMTMPLETEILDDAGNAGRLLRYWQVRRSWWVISGAQGFHPRHGFA